MNGFTLALAQYPIEPLASLAEWQAKLSRWVEAAVARKAQLLVFPEYGAMELASLDPASMSDLEGSLRFVAALGEDYARFHADLAARHGVHILAASLPVPLADGRVVNRARLHAPNGASGHQDKIVMTRFERERWGISGGDTIRAFRTTLGVIGVSICYDVEFPMIARAQAEAGARLILAPSCTDTMRGYWRVRVGAQARALENQCLVAQAPTVGMAPWSPVLDENYGAAGLYAPPDGDAPDDGVLALGGSGEAMWLFAEVDLARTDRWRETGAVRPFHHWPEQFVTGPCPTPPCELVDLS